MEEEGCSTHAYILQWYGNVEVVLGASKILLVVGACILMLVVNLGGWLK